MEIRRRWGGFCSSLAITSACWHAATPSQVVGRRELAAELSDQLAKLKPSYRDVIFYRNLQGLSFDELNYGRHCKRAWTLWKVCIVWPAVKARSRLRRVIVRADSATSSFKDLADDLRRVLAGEPTIARPPTLLDHGVRLATKYRGAVATIAVFCVLALASFAVSNARLAAQKQVSDDNATLAKNNEAIAREAIDRLGTQMADLLGDIPAANSVRHRLLTETLDYYQRLAAESASHDSPDRDQQLDLAIIHGSSTIKRILLCIHGQIGRAALSLLATCWNSV